MDDFFTSEEEELDDLENVELITRYENMVKGKHSIYLSEDDYEHLFIHYSHLFFSPFPLMDANLNMAGKVIRDGLAQHPNATSLQLFAVYYRYLNERLTTEKTIQLLKQVDLHEYNKTIPSYYLANIYAKIDASKEAIALYQKLLEEVQHDEEKVSIYSDLIFLLDKEEDLPQMLDYYEKVMTIDPERTTVLFRDLSIHLLFKPEFGSLFFESFVQRQPFSANGWHCLGQLYSILSLYEKATEALNNAVALSDDPGHLIALAEVYNVMGEKAKALDFFLEVIALHPKRTDCYLDIADLYYALGQVELALRYYAMSLDAFPDDPEAFMGTAIALASMKKYEEAISYLEKIRKRNVVPVEALLLMSDYLIELERDEDAITLFEQMTELHPLVADVWLSYSNYYASYENYTQAYAILRCGMFTMRDNVQLMYRMANYYFLEGKLERTISFLETAYLIDPTYLDMFFEYDDDVAKNPMIMDIINDLKKNN